MYSDEPIIYDIPEGGIRLSIPLSDGISINCDMSDEVAQVLVDIIQNKLNARL